MSETSTRAAAIERLYDIIDQVGVAMLTTRQPDEALRARPMRVAEAERGGPIVFLTDETMPKVAEVEAMPEVNVSFADRDRGRYASVSGRAALAHDPERIRKLWKSDFDRWFPQGPADGRLALLEVTVDQAEYWDESATSREGLAGFVRTLVASAGADETSPPRHARFDRSARKRPKTKTPRRPR
jgi:general stress protein 26